MAQNLKELGAPNMKIKENEYKHKQKMAMSWETLDETGGS